MMTHDVWGDWNWRNKSESFLAVSIHFGKLVIWRHGCFLKWWYPQNTPKWSLLVGKPMVVGYHYFRKPPHEHVSSFFRFNASGFETQNWCRCQQNLGLRIYVDSTIEHRHSRWHFWCVVYEYMFLDWLVNNINKIYVHTFSRIVFPESCFGKFLKLFEYFDANLLTFFLFVSFQRRPPGMMGWDSLTNDEKH